MIHRNQCYVFCVLTAIAGVTNTMNGCKYHVDQVTLFLNVSHEYGNVTITIPRLCLTSQTDEAVPVMVW